MERETRIKLSSEKAVLIGKPLNSQKAQIDTFFRYQSESPSMKSEQALSLLHESESGESESDGTCVETTGLKWLLELDGQ